MTEPDFEALRKAMVANQLRTSAVSDPAVVAAMNAVAREAFVPAGREVLAYVDRAVPLGRGRALNPPLATGRLINALEIGRGEHVLVIGGATGYAAAVLAAMGAQVTTLEADETLVEQARRALGGHASVKVMVGPLADGWSAGAPYDAILVDGAIEQVPAALAAQLADGGRMAAGLVERGVTRLASGRKAGMALRLTDFADVEAVILPGFAALKAFVF